MNKDLLTRVRKEALYIVQSKKTLREVAKVFGISKSTIHKDMKERLKKISPELFRQVRNVLEEHLEIRHIKGGETTKQKYLKKQVS